MPIVDRIPSTVHTVSTVVEQHLPTDNLTATVVTEKPNPIQLDPVDIDLDVE